jgi:hypothetical protein
MPTEFEPTTDQRALVQNAAAFGPVDLSKFATLKGSQATGANKTKLRLTNLKENK